MNAYELADELDSHKNTWFSEIANMLRQLADRIALLESQVDKLLDHCPDPECWECGKIICPYGGEMHFHHDGCPTCAEMEYEEKNEKILCN